MLDFKWKERMLMWKIKKIPQCGKYFLRGKDLSEEEAKNASDKTLLIVSTRYIRTR